MNVLRSITSALPSLIDKIYRPALVTLIALWAVACPGEKIPEYIKAAAKAPPGGVIVTSEVQQRSKKGIVHTGRHEMTEAQLDLADEGVNEFNGSFKNDGFTVKPKEHSFYQISTPPFPCILSPIQRVPSFAVSGGTVWDGSKWDQYNSKGKLKEIFVDSQGMEQWYKKDSISVVLAPEMVLSVGTPNSRPPNGWMYLCPDDSVLKNGARYGAEHIALANFPYNEENRDRPPYDGYNYFNCSMYHGNNVNHPLLERAGRCVSESIIEAMMMEFDIGEELEIPDELKKEAAEAGFAIDGKMVRGVPVRVVL